MAYDPNDAPSPEMGSAQDRCGDIAKHLGEMGVPQPIAMSLVELIKSLTKDSEPAKPKSMDNAFSGMHEAMKPKGM